MERVATLARQRGVSLALHTHVNAAQSVTPLFARAARAMLDAGVRDVRNQGVLMRGVNDNQQELLDLCFALLDEAGVSPYYFYMCDMIPNAEHWRVALWEAQELQHQIMGYLPGFATPRIVCDVPYLGKRWVHQVASYDRQRGISYWTKNYLTSIEADDPAALSPALRVLRPDPDALSFRARPGGGAHTRDRPRSRRDRGDTRRAATGVGPEGFGAMNTHDTERPRTGSCRGRDPARGAGRVGTPRACTRSSNGRPTRHLMRLRSCAATAGSPTRNSTPQRTGWLTVFACQVPAREPSSGYSRAGRSFRSSASSPASKPAPPMCRSTPGTRRSASVTSPPSWTCGCA